MPELQQQTENIFNYGYDKSLYKEGTNETSIVYDIMNQTEAQSIQFGSLQSGSGTKSFQVSPEQGLWMGGEKFVDAQFSVDMEGNMTTTGGSISGGTVTGSTFQTAASGSRFKIYPINPANPVFRVYDSLDNILFSIANAGNISRTEQSTTDNGFFDSSGGSTTGVANIGAIRLDGNQTGLKIYGNNQSRTTGQYVLLQSTGLTADSTSLLKFSGDSAHTGKLMDISYTGSGRIYDDSQNNVFINKRGYIRQYSMIFEDDFMEGNAALAASIWSKAHWTGTAVGTGTAILNGAGTEGGQIRLDTGGNANSSETLTFTTPIFKFTREPILDWGFYLPTNTLANQQVEMGWYVDANDCLMFRIKPNDPNLYLVTENNNAGEVETDTGQDIAVQTWYNLKIEMTSSTLFKIYLNNMEILSSHATNTVRDLDTFKPRFYVNNQALADNRRLDLDFVRVYQRRAY